MIHVPFVILSLGLSCFAYDLNQAETYFPIIDGDWWTIAGNPDLGPLNGSDQYPTAFGIWQAADDTWQLWSCIRGTKIGGNTRLFHRWQASKLSDRQWQPMGITMTADENFGETPGGLQTPHATKIGDNYYLFYGDWENICLAVSQDGKTFARQLNEKGRSGLFSEGTGAKTRDAMLMSHGGTYYLYYAAAPDDKGAIYARTSKDLMHWSDSTIVSSGGSAGTDFESAESPYVLYLPDANSYYLFRSHKSLATGKFVTTVYRSSDPLDFGVNTDEYRLSTLDIEGIWIVKHENEYYIAALRPDLQGTRITRLEWEER